jgi:hypothetical protein
MIGGGGGGGGGCAAACDTADSLLDSASYARWVLLSPAAAVGVGGRARPHP